MKKIINMLERITKKLNNMSDRDKMILGYICIVSVVIGPITLIVKTIIKLIGLLF